MKTKLDSFMKHVLWLDWWGTGSLDHFEEPKDANVGELKELEA